MFNKALFKQSCKANGVMWAIITFAVCFMLACVMMISGGGNIGKVKNAVEDTIIEGEINAQLDKRALNYYDLSNESLTVFDGYFVDNFAGIAGYDAQFASWLSNKPELANYGTEAEYQQALLDWNDSRPAITTVAQGVYVSNFSTWQNKMPVRESFDSDSAYNTALGIWNNSKPVGTTAVITADYQVSALQLKNYIIVKARNIDSAYTETSTETQEMTAVAFCAVDPTLNDTLNNIYVNNSETLPGSYDVASLASNISTGTISTYLTSAERTQYKEERAKISSAIFLAGNMTSESTITLMLEALSGYGVTEEKYNSFGYTYQSIKHSAITKIVSYQARYDYEVSLIDQNYTTAESKQTEEYKNAILNMKTSLNNDLTNSLLSSLPKSVSSALEEVGQMDLYSLIVGSIFYKMAGLLLPIIYMIMASNNLIAGQVDSGSMAYVLSTSTKRKQVTFTQAIYLIGSLFAMFCCTAITSVVCLAILNNSALQLTYGKLLLLNLGAFVTMLAMSGICFFASCWFNRSKYSMSLGGGLSMFFLVATMLGLFGSKVIPSVVRLDALNNFNYVSIISLFDVISIIDGTTTFIWKFAILIAIGLIGYIAGSIKFQKKDLPL